MMMMMMTMMTELFFFFPTSGRRSCGQFKTAHDAREKAATEDGRSVWLTCLSFTLHSHYDCCVGVKLGKEIDVRHLPIGLQSRNTVAKLSRAA